MGVTKMSGSIYARAIFFDAVGTLFHVRGGVGQVYWEIARPYGVRTTPEAIEQAFHEIFPKAPPLVFSRLQAGLLRRSEKKWWYAVVLEVFRRVGMIRNFDQYFEEVFRAFAGIRGWELYPETRDALHDLKKAGFVLGVISNFDSRILTVCTDLEIFEYLDSIQISSREGAAKPDPQIFLKALQHHNLQPREAVHVGDSLKDDVKGAAAAGLIPIYLNRSHHPEAPEGVLSIETLTEILSSVKPL
ncbi:MAG TPA: HAD-IA family hydrolase [Nitrospiria bacterium]|jgi:putative hydrolase of the HAD superfamily|nr:HAD-IA family hydrolase [Nitrospiria bacterium]